MPQPRRIFLDPAQPALHAAVDWLIQDQVRDGRLDLSRTVIVLPGARARRRFVQILAKSCVSAGILHHSGSCITIGQLPELLYDNARPLATATQSLLAMGGAIGDLSAGEMDILDPGLSGVGAEERLKMASQLMVIHRRLGSEAWSFSSVHDKVSGIEDFPGKTRWQVLAKLQDLYYRRLDREGLWDRQAARNVAAKRDGACSTDKSIVLIGTVDLNRMTHLILERVPDRVTVLVSAEQATMSEGFDALGSVVSDWWVEYRLQIPDDRLFIVDRPIDQAQAVAEFLHQLPSDIATDEITVAVPDEEVAVHVGRLLSNQGIPARRLEGTELSRSRPGRLVNLVLEWLEDQTFERFASLVRHPDIFRFVSTSLKSETWIKSVDEFQGRFLPDVLSLKKLSGYRGVTTIDKSIKALAKCLDQLLSDLSRLASIVRPEPGEGNSANGKLHGHTPHEIAVTWGEFVERIYADLPFAGDVESERTTAAALKSIGESLGEVASLTMENAGLLNVFTVGGLIMQRLESLQSAGLDGDESDPAAIELTGWLDVAMDDSRALILTGFNEHNLPSSEAASPFLSNSLSQRLGLLDINRRYARDASILAGMIRCRSHVWLVAGRRDGGNTPRLPSRLMFAEEDEVVRRRAESFFSFVGSDSSRRWMKSTRAPAVSQTIPVPTPVSVPRINSISVTRLRDFVNCPYRFYLANVLSLTEAGDDSRELDGGAFGDLAHNVLEIFGNSDIADSDSDERIFEFLKRELHRQQRISYPFPAAPAAAIQVANLEKRFRAFSKIQADRRRNGWEIVRVEPRVVMAIEVDGEPFEIVGKIDRVDRHVDGRLAIWDYKTSDAGKTVEQAHRRKGEWVDFQLPLYRRLLAGSLPESADQTDAIGLGYILLPGEVSGVCFDSAKWTPAELHDADTKVIDVLRRIRAGEFWPMTQPPPLFSAALGGICQDNVFERWIPEKESVFGDAPGSAARIDPGTFREEK